MDVSLSNASGLLFDRPHECTEIFLISEHVWRTCCPKHRRVRISSNSDEADSKARCRRDIAVGISHENDPVELLLIANCRAGDRDTSDLFAFCGVVRERGRQGGGAPSAGRKRQRIIAMLNNCCKGPRRASNRREIVRARTPFPIQQGGEKQLAESSGSVAAGVRLKCSEKL
jgi:hypothetical protein